ncbi:DNA polymerase Y family protein [Desulfosediminicola sp.]|uniref:DNA polymerase Y family protein n=1 Tax=Desulfosediminicola sp. TaxID=2886825 RepID=UPI003AF2ED92
MERSILHFNVADFAVAVERVADITLRSKPLIVAPLGAARAVVYDMSEEAYQCGVRKGMALNLASRLCRGSKVVQPRTDLYRKAMGTFLKRVQSYSPLIEHGLEDGHLFVDLTGTHRLFGPPPDVGWRVRREVRDGLGINPIWTLASNKLVAKVSSRLVKPVGEYIVATGEEQEFLAPLSLSLLPGLQGKELSRLQEFHISTIGQLAELSRSQLMVPFGSRCEFLHQASHGQDNSLVMGGPQQSAPIDHEHLFATDTNDQQEVESIVGSLVSRAAVTLRHRRQVARRIGVWIHYSDGSHVVRQATLKQGSSSDFGLRQLAMLALKRAWIRRTRLRSVRLVCDRLHRQSPQLSLFPETTVKERSQEKVLSAMDTIRARFGHSLINIGGARQTNPAVERLAV